MPINMKFVEGTKAFAGQKAYTKQEAMDHFRRTAEVATQAVHLPVGRRQQRGVHRVAGPRRRGGHALLGRAVRPRDLEGRDSGLRQAGRRRVPAVARDRRRQEHRERQRAPEAGASVVRVLRRQVGRRVGIAEGETGKAGMKPSERSFSPSAFTLSARRFSVGSASRRRSPSRGRCRRSTAHAPRSMPISAVPVSVMSQEASPGALATPLRGPVDRRAAERALRGAGQLEIVGAGRAERALARCCRSAR